MNTNKEPYKKLYVLSPEYYKKLQKQQTKLTLDQPLDEMLFKIMQNKKPNIHTKWLMYKNALIKFKELKDRNTLKIPQNKEEENEKDTSFKTPHLTKLLKNNPSYFWDSEFDNIQTPVTSKPRKSVTFPGNLNKSQSDLFNKYRIQHNLLNSSQEEEDDNLNKNNKEFLNQTPEPIFDSTRNQGMAEVFEHDPNKSVENITTDEIEQQLFEVAKQTLGEQNEQNIVRLDDTLDHDFRVFENRKTRDLIAIEVEPVQKFVEKAIQPSFSQEEAPRDDVSPIILNIDEYTSNEHQPKYIRLSETPLTSSAKKTSSEKRRSIHLRNRRIEGRRSSSLSRIQYKRKTPPKKNKKLNQPQQGKGINLSWSSFNQKKI